MTRTPPRLPLPCRPPPDLANATACRDQIAGLGVARYEIDELEPLVIGPKRAGLAHEHSRFRHRNRPRPHAANVRQWRLSSRGDPLRGCSGRLGLCQTVLITQAKADALAPGAPATSWHRRASRAEAGLLLQHRHEMAVIYTDRGPDEGRRPSRMVPQRTRLFRRGSMQSFGRFLMRSVRPWRRKQ
jgi:hypothetical protein